MASLLHSNITSERDYYQRHHQWPTEQLTYASVTISCNTEANKKKNENKNIALLMLNNRNKKKNRKQHFVANKVLPEK